MPRNWGQATADPAYIEVWERASKRSPLTIPMTSKKDAVRLRLKLYETRKILEAHQHPLISLILGMSIYINPTTNAISIESSDTNIKAALANIGIGALEAPDLGDI